MQALTEKVFYSRPPYGLFDLTLIRNLFPELSDSAIKALIHRAVGKGEILRLKRGIFCLESPLRDRPPHPYALAAYLHSPSFVSFESALGFHGYIPEAVYQAASTTADRSMNFMTPLGYYSYQCVPCRFFRAGVRAHKLDDRAWAFIATPLRAIADIIYFNKKVLWNRDGLHFLKESLRIEDEDLEQIPENHYEEVITNIRNLRIQEYLEGMRKELAC